MVIDPACPTVHDRIRLTIAAYCHRTDDGDLDGWVRLFTADGRFRMAGRDHVGHAALRAFIEQDQAPGRRGLHLTTDSLISVAGERAQVVSNFLFVADGAEGSLIVAAGRYRDVLVPQGEEWLFLEREAVLAGPVTQRAWGSRAATTATP